MSLEGIDHLDILYTHCHYDHIIGLPYFMPLYNPMMNVRLWSGHLAGVMTTREIVKQFMRPPWFPVEPEICKASLAFRDFRSGDVLTLTTASPSALAVSTTRAAASATVSNLPAAYWR